MTGSISHADKAEKLTLAVQRPAFSLGNPVHRAGLNNLLNEAAKQRSLDSGSCDMPQESKTPSVEACSCEQIRSCMDNYRVESSVHPRASMAKIDNRSRRLSSSSRWSGIFGTVATKKTIRLPMKDETAEGPQAYDDIADETQTSIIVYPSPWLVKLGLGFAAQADISWSLHGWKLMQQTWRIIPYNSPIFRACKYGDIKTVAELFAERKASVWDISESGETLLHVRSQLLLSVNLT